MTTDKVIIIGAGLSGIAMGIQLKRKLGHINFEIYEKLGQVGGTWTQNTYPNLSCDVASQYYSFSFCLNPDWSETFARQPEILSYLNDCVAKFNLGSHIHLRQECISSRWSTEDHLWTTTFMDLATQKQYNRQAKFLITAVGVLNVPKGIDDVPVLNSFQGDIFHTSEWRHIDFEGKKVLVLGNGCSANQVVPWILTEGKAKSIVQVVRSEQWVAPKNNVRNGKWFKWCLRNVPFATRIYRLWTAFNLDLNFYSFKTNRLGNYLRRSLQEGVRLHMASTASKRYHDILIPRYGFGAKRPVMDHGYLDCTNRDNFTLVKADGIRSVGVDGRTIVDATNQPHETDIVILANGFKTQEIFTPMEIWGQDGQELRQLWRDTGGARAYMGVCMAGFPNFFTLTGPNTLPTGNSTLHGVECSVIYILRLLDTFLKPRARSGPPSTYIVVRAVAEDAYNDYIRRHLKSLVYTTEVNTWYIDKHTGRNTLIWPGTQFSFWWSRCVKAIEWGDFEIPKQKFT